MNVINLLEEMGVIPKRVASCNGGEYHSRCPDPRCDGKDRFCSWPKEGNDGRYWCRQCLRSGDAIQFCRDFMGMDYPSACIKVGKEGNYSKNGPSVYLKEKFKPKLLTLPSEQWRKNALALVNKSHQYLLDHPELLNEERDRGLTKQSITNFQLGWNPLDTFENRQLWGLQDTSFEGGSKFLFLPSGIVIPSIRDNVLIRVKIRRKKWQAEGKYPKYQIITGGISAPAIYGSVGKPIVLVEAELDAMLIQQCAGDLCCSVALGGVSNRPDTVLDSILRKSSIIMFALDFDEAGKKAFQFWKSTYLHLFPWPVPRGKSPGDAYTQGVDLIKWIKSGLKRTSPRI